MADPVPLSNSPSIRPVVQSYLKACENLLAGTDGAHDLFLKACNNLESKSLKYTDEELALIEGMSHRVSEDGKKKKKDDRLTPET